MNRLSISLRILLPFLLASSLRAGWEYRAYTDGHVDIGPRVVAGELRGFWKNDGASVDGQISSPDFPPHGIRALGIFDEDTPPLIRPSGSQWDFLGVAAGEPIYILPSGGTPNTVPFLGFSTEDASLSALGADNFRITLVAMTAPGDAVFSLYLNTSDIPMNTLDGFPAGALEIAPGDHLHFNWAFSHLGTYDLTFEFEALSGEEVVLSGTDTFRVQITEGGGYSDYHQWRITHFRPEEIPDDAISGPAADPHGLGIRNEQVYAFGFDPVIELIQLTHEGETVPGLRFHERTGSDDLLIRVQRATDLSAGDWLPADAVMQDAERVFHDPGLEERTYRLPSPAQGSTFLRAHAGE